MRKFTALAALTLGLSLTVAACGSDDTTPADTASSSVSTSEHNDADVTFASQMIQHHAQALDMVDLTEGRALDPEVQALADDIRAAQAPEIEKMSGWLRQWGEDVPETGGTGDDGMGGMDHGDMDHGDSGDMGDMGDSGMDMPGMMTADEMTDLKDATDAEFQDMWLTMMVKHHQGAVEMAKTEEAGGRYQPAVSLAESIQESQTAEIEKMQGLLSS